MNRSIAIGLLLAILSGVGYLLAVLAYVDTHTLNTKVIVWGVFAVIADMACVACFVGANKTRQKPPGEFR